MSEDIVGIEFFDIVGLYGAKDDHLVDPSDPDCDLVVVVFIEHLKHVYFIDTDVFRSVDQDCKIGGPVWLRSPDNHVESYRTEIRQYLESDNIIVQHEYEIIGFNKLIIPMVRRAYPKLALNKIVSVQPMTIATAYSKLDRSQEKL